MLALPRPLALAPAPSARLRLVSGSFQTLPLRTLWLCVPPLPPEEPRVVPDVRPPTLSCTFRGVLRPLFSSFLLGSLVPGHWRDPLRCFLRESLRHLCQEQLFFSRLLIWPSLAVREGRRGEGKCSGSEVHGTDFDKQPWTPPGSSLSPTQCPWWLEALGLQCFSVSERVWIWPVHSFLLPPPAGASESSRLLRDFWARVHFFT